MTNISDKACLRCGGELKELPAPPDQAGLGTTIKTYVCETCGMLENRMSFKLLKEFLKGKK